METEYFRNQFSTFFPIVYDAQKLLEDEALVGEDLSLAFKIIQEQDCDIKGECPKGRF